MTLCNFKDMVSYVCKECCNLILSILTHLSLIRTATYGELKKIGKQIHIFSTLPGINPLKNHVFLSVYPNIRASLYVSHLHNTFSFGFKIIKKSETLSLRLPVLIKCFEKISETKDTNLLLRMRVESRDSFCQTSVVRENFHK